MSLVFFDFDGTLTTRDTIVPLGLFLASTRAGRVGVIIRLMWLVTLMKVRLLTNHAFKARFCDLFLKGETTDRIKELSHVFARDCISPILNAETLEELRRHSQRGDEVYVVSSNFDFVLHALNELMRVRGIIATEPEVAAGRYTGRLLGPACVGPEKLARVLAQFERDRVEEAVAYGDSRDDRQLLGFVKTAIWV